MYIAWTSPILSGGSRGVSKKLVSSKVQTNWLEFATISSFSHTHFDVIIETNLCMVIKTDLGCSLFHHLCNWVKLITQAIVFIKLAVWMQESISYSAEQTMATR